MEAGFLSARNELVCFGIAGLKGYLASVQQIFFFELPAYMTDRQRMILEVQGYTLSRHYSWTSTDIIIHLIGRPEEALELRTRHLLRAAKSPAIDVCGWRQRLSCRAVALTPEFHTFHAIPRPRSQKSAQSVSVSVSRPSSKPYRSWQSFKLTS